MFHKFFNVTLISAILLSLNACIMTEVSSPKATETLVLESDTFSVKNKHMHMMGPLQNKFFYFENPAKPEIIWIQSFKTEVAVDNVKVSNTHLMCHNTIEKNKKNKKKTPKLFEKTDGWFIGVSSSNHMETQFPKGFAVPLSTGDQFFVNSQVANHEELKVPKQVKYKTHIAYSKDRETKTTLRPLYRRTLMALTPRYEGYCDFGKKGLRSPTSKSQCSRQKAMMRHGGYHDSVDKHGQVFSSHWMAKPGKTVNRTLVTDALNIPVDTKIHYISAHIHKGVKSIKLIDLTDNKTIYENKVSSKDGHDYTEVYSSSEGIKLLRDHEYQMVTLVENTKNKNIDIMAMLYVYMEDHNFRKL